MLHNHRQAPRAEGQAAGDAALTDHVHRVRCGLQSLLVQMLEEWAVPNMFFLELSESVVLAIGLFHGTLVKSLLNERRSTRASCQRRGN